ncbi:Pectinesterase, catalytic [Corchorus olitorius]|uniref:Pectinesterase, catalytic n=1 Tax=Corchorus olitorius TaxID=93759 RepID=A0A1R3JFK2_9ROSI|nr:Pectinesterase, catalytic [Corchorus olitorius]
MASASLWKIHIKEWILKGVVQIPVVNMFKEEHNLHRDCHIYGTVDFVVGAAKAVFRNCNLFAHLPNQTITIHNHSPVQSTRIQQIKSTVSNDSSLKTRGKSNKNRVEMEII